MIYSIKSTRSTIFASVITPNLLDKQGQMLSWIYAIQKKNGSDSTTYVYVEN